MKPAPTLAELLASLPEEERFILSLHYVKGMPTIEIAQTLGVPNKVVGASAFPWILARWEVAQSP